MRSGDPPRGSITARSGLERPSPGSPPTPRVPDADRRMLDCGLRLVAVPEHHLPQVVLRLVLPAGAAVEHAGAPGTASLVGELLTEGTERWAAAEVNQRLDRLGASLNIDVMHDFAEVELLSLSETLREAVEILAEVVTRPTFPAAEVERVRREVLDALDARRDEPANVADDLLSSAIFGPDHPYGRFAGGTREGIRSVRIESLRAFHTAFFRPGGSYIVAAGDFVADRLESLLDETLASWRGSVDLPSRPAVPTIAAAAGERITAEREDAPQAEIRLGGVGMERASPDWIPGAVANYILGGSTITGRLGANLRETKGWTYGARSGFSAGVHPGGWIVETAVDAAVAEMAVREIRAEIRSLHERGPEPDELRRAQEALVLSLPRAFETPARIVNRLSTLEAFELPLDYWHRFPEAVRAVTAEEVVRIVERYMAPDDLAEVVVG
jgi:zinc protease